MAASPTVVAAAAEIATISGEQPPQPSQVAVAATKQPDEMLVPPTKTESCSVVVEKPAAPVDEIKSDESVAALPQPEDKNVEKAKEDPEPASAKVKPPRKTPVIPDVTPPPPVAIQTTAATTSSASNKKKPIQAPKTPTPVTPSRSKIVVQSAQQPDDSNSKRHRSKTILYQSPTPELTLVTKLSVVEANAANGSAKHHEDRLVLFYK